MGISSGYSWNVPRYSKRSERRKGCGAMEKPNTRTGEGELVI